MVKGARLCFQCPNLSPSPSSPYLQSVCKWLQARMGTTGQVMSLVVDDLGGLGDLPWGSPCPLQCRVPGDKKLFWVLCLQFWKTHLKCNELPDVNSNSPLGCMRVGYVYIVSGSWTIFTSPN